MPTHALVGFEALVVDDEPEIRELLAEYLRGRGLTVATAHDGRAAVGALERSAGRYRLVLTDINMPGADGLAVLRAARAVNASAYVVIVTGYASLDSAIQAVRLGAHDYLPKPFSLGQIDVILQKIGDRMSLERENRELTLRSTTNSLPWLGARLDAIEHGLARIETLLADGRPH
jgi:DNA-binding NtrC family response regulator